MSKFCGGCKKTLDLTQFYNNKRKRDGKQTQCKPCMKKQNEINYKKHKLTWDKRSEEWRNKPINKKRERKRITKWQLQERKKNPSYKMKCTLRGRLLSALKGCKKDASTMELLGCSVLQLQCHFGRQFDEYMTLTNHGKTGWHMDHRVPCAAFNLKNPLHQRVCFWYKNLQPMWAKDNIKKNAKYKEEDKQALIKEWIFYHI